MIKNIIIGVLVLGLIFLFIAMMGFDQQVQGYHVLLEKSRTELEELKKSQQDNQVVADIDEDGIDDTITISDGVIHINSSVVGEKLWYVFDKDTGTVESAQ